MPALNLTATSMMTFWHNFDFAQFLGSTPETAYQSGAVLEISDDGLIWRDLGPFITTGGYNGVVDTASVAPLAGSRAWVGSSDAALGTRADAMHQVVVNLGAAITDPSMFNSLVLDGALIRFRMGGTFQVLIGGVQGTGWGVDDIVVSGVRSPGLCGAICTTQPVFAGVNQVSASPSSSCGLLVRWNPGVVGCPGASLRYNVYRSTDPSFTPAPSNAVALGVVGTSYLDVTGLEHGTTYYYMVRAEDSTTHGGGPANGGNADSNLVRAGGTPSGPLAPGPDFVDDLEPAPVAGYSTFSTRNVGGWAITNDTTAHSPNQAWVVLDLQPSAPPNTQANDTLTLPVLNLTSTSTMTFWHNFDFARFPTATADTAFQSGGVLEISADGVVWRDLDLFITTGGYNGVVDGGATPAMSPLAGRRAWVGSSDQGPIGGANNPVATRTDPMQQVVVDLGAAIAGLYNTATLDGARVRFRMGGTFQILTNGTRGIGWGVDDISVTGLRAPGVCTTIEPAGRADRLRVVRSPAGQVTLSWDASCSSGDFDYEVYEGSLPTLPSQFSYDHSSRFCSTGGDTTKTFTPAEGSRYYLIVPRNGVNEGSYGQASSGAERPASGSSCLAQSIGTCN